MVSSGRPAARCRAISRSPTHTTGHGLPRPVNNLADQALLDVFVHNRTIVDEASARAVAADCEPGLAGNPGEQGAGLRNDSVVELSVTHLGGAEHGPAVLVVVRP